ncbi:MAG: energy transducer TonB [Planctomycetes bacterium]|jgi:protein TonB|nr:energy transducer TonB [Planctomycetota bacterium]
MALARTTLLWSLLAHGGMVAWLCWLGQGTFSRPQLVPPLVQMEWRQSVSVTAMVAPAEPAVVIEPVLAEPVTAAEVVDDALPSDANPTEPTAADFTPAERCACPSFAELRRSLRRTEAPIPEPISVTPPAPAAAEPLARVLVPIAGTTIAPRYPASARRRDQEGTVLLAVTVAADGSVRDALVVRSSGHMVLDEEAVRTVRLWRFAGGPGVCEQAIEFRLRAAAGA